MPTWCFKAAMPRHARDTSAMRWYWQIDTDAQIAVTSPKLFATLEECVANARENGFRGVVEMPERIGGDTVINCEAGDYVHGVVQQSLRNRAEHAAA